MVTVRVDRIERLTPATVFAGASIAWTVLLALASWGHSSGHLSGLAAAFLMWNVMMVAMMLPSLTPWLVLFERGEAARFALGYFGLWSAYCLVAALAQHALRDGVALSGHGAAAVLIVAGLYQFTPLKQSCLRKCRSPLGQLLTRWQSGKHFSFRIGAAHGMNCVGCCWALMTVAFALGVMNLWWMAALTALLLAEKMLPRGPDYSRWTGAALVACGVGWLLV